MSNDIANINAPVDTAIAGTAATIFSPEGLNQLMKFAEVMAQSRVTVPAHLAGKPADCMAVAMQAAQWGMSPFAVAQKTHVVNGTLGYEAQLVNAVVQNSGAIKGRFHYEYRGEGASLECRVGAVIRGEQEITWNEWLCISSITTKNSPLWKTNPKQQFGYLQVKNWARAHTPGAILGVYTPDELEERPRVERDITPPAADARSVNSLILKNTSQNDAPAAQHRPRNERTPDELLAGFTEYAGNASDVADLDSTYAAVAKRLASHQEHLDKATDVYSLRREEMTAAQ
ncbi:recombinase RecT [Cronobacter sakazakii]|uniref:RecT family recombinase n=1 Tax=Cronobacter TaxID=413496 RepID=UPI00051955C7|nr:RecT family recombinase [Cronobacter malonaticus]EJJ0660982.1 recombinase RecT [Cronobacter sakazakii]EGT4286852.1 recombinase RecT [Cronobacter malonaticus]EJJ0668129.1 recombinase RecT [Cronobacter sakazakii]EKY1953199.1 recombinase RecT [Cronobacter sakazakii]EKY1956038.1 recombinase RecT [Cronobacter sakazakii]